MKLFLTILLLTSMILNAKNIKIATGYWPPYENIKNVQNPGLCTEVIAKVLTQMEVEADFVEYPWKRAVVETFEGRIDTLYCAFFSSERAKFTYYPDESIVDAKYLLYVRVEDKKRLKYDSLKDLDAKRIGILRGASYPEVFTAYIKEHAFFEEVTKPTQNFQKLFLGRVDYIVAEQGNASVILKKLKLEKKIIPLLNKSVREDSLYMVFGKKTNTQEFVNAFSSTLKTFKESQEYQEILDKYFQEF